MLEQNTLTAKELCEFHELVGFGPLDEDQIEDSLRGSLVSFKFVEDSRTLGIGRVIGDGARNFYLQDIYVHPDAQRRGIGSAIVNALLNWIKSSIPSGRTATIGLMPATGKEPFYEHFGFSARPNARQGSGMQRFLTADAPKE
ncbi:MAG: GNAT family N-acetyltransferase [Candidatus Spyradocola sp.]